jgi:PAS domain S-box-containing protein
MDYEGKTSYWNNAAEKMFGYCAQETIAKDLHELIAPQRYYEAFQKSFPNFQKTGKGCTMDQMLELTAKRKDGTEFPIELSLSTMKLRGRWHALGIIRDISERRVLEAQLVQAQKLESIGQLAAGIAHEINTPTQYVSYNTNFLKEQFELLDPLLDNYQALFEAAKAGTVPGDLISEIDAFY